MIIVKRTYRPREKGEIMANINFINLEEQNITALTAREAIAYRIRTLSRVCAHDFNYTTAAALSEAQAIAVKRYGYTWEEVEAIEFAAIA